VKILLETISLENAKLVAPQTNIPILTIEYANHAILLVRLALVFTTIIAPHAKMGCFSTSISDALQLATTHYFSIL